MGLTLYPIKMTETAIFQKAVNHWWAVKVQAAVRKSKQGGSRDENLTGKNLDVFISTIFEFLVRLGVDEHDIFVGGQFSKSAATLPSYFRPSKNWDLVVISNSRFSSKALSTQKPRLHVAMEFKSQDKSIGNNQNNRMEESLGNACDFWSSYERQLFTSLLPRPWLGYFFIGKYADKDHVKKEVRQPHFLARDVFRGGPDQFTDVAKFPGPTYAERYRIFLEQAIGKKLYDAGAFLTTNEEIRDKFPNHCFPFPEFGAANFLKSLEAHIRVHYRR